MRGGVTPCQRFVWGKIKHGSSETRLLVVTPTLISRLDQANVDVYCIQLTLCGETYIAYMYAISFSYLTGCTYVVHRMYIPDPIL